MNMKNRKKVIINIVFAAYLLIMLWLLFGRRIGKGDLSDLRLIPFSTILSDLSHTFTMRGYEQRRAFLNLTGNVLLFVPLGAYLPYYSKNLKKLSRFLICALVIDVVIELTQYLFGLGCCDIDDVLLNVPGMLLGRWLYIRFAER